MTFKLIDFCKNYDVFLYVLSAHYKVSFLVCDSSQGLKVNSLSIKSKDSHVILGALLFTINISRYRMIPRYLNMRRVSQVEPSEHIAKVGMLLSTRVN